VLSYTEKPYAKFTRVIQVKDGKSQGHAENFTVQAKQGGRKEGSALFLIVKYLNFEILSTKLLLTTFWHIISIKINC